MQVGLLVGRRGARDTVLLLIPTPHKVCDCTSAAQNQSIPLVRCHYHVNLWLDAQETTAAAVLQVGANKSGKKQKKQLDVQLDLDVDLIVEHAIQVAAMLPGGDPLHRVAVL